MMELKPYPDKHNPIGYIEERQRGTRIIIVIDDFFNLPDWHKIDPSKITTESGLDTAGGLLMLYNSAREWEHTRAIGFFNLPDPNKIQADADKIINCIDQWLDCVCQSVVPSNELSHDETRTSCRKKYSYYTLVDLYFGKKSLVGHKFISRWKESKIVPKEKEKLAYLSTAGAILGWSDPHGLRVFSKGKIDVAGRLTSDIEEWLNFEPVALEKVWERTTDWFRDNRSHVVTHDFHEKWFEPWSSEATNYKDAVESGLGFQFPAHWWQDPTSIKNIHESLKHLCGAVFCGTTNEDGCRNISVGAAFLIALKAHHDRFRNLGSLVNDLTWKGAFRSTAAIYPLQSTKEAKASAIALYEFFYRMFEPRPGESSLNSSQVRTTFFEQSGVVLRIQLKWDATKPASDRSKNLAQMLSTRFESSHVKVPDSPRPGAIAENTRNSITQLWRTMMLNQNGFMSPGVIYMDKDDIIIASTEYLVWGDPGEEDEV